MGQYTLTTCGGNADGVYMMGVSSTRNDTGTSSLVRTRIIYGDGTMLQGFLGQGVGHIAPVNEQLMLEFFSLIGNAPPPLSSSMRTPSGPDLTSWTTSTRSAPPTGPAQKLWGQYGGSCWTGSTSCVSTARCTTQNPWYAQCVPS
ncbi:hypothetical protein S40285_05897 [Stachybotrys chlorohalonatus IBT 40285]|uniref:CBM1 domain-containing protein n=1 Tax=Stachybotrys chlorohalonatus (strain IBT 40285) TaxID=1283841 RepID=A0A084QGL3_STAC4|nr:hypothetical protein S40285_05897 [Stachybotrys chlorohalonata IBT 40285]